MKNYFLAVIFIIINSCNHNTSNDIIDGQVDKNYLFNSSNTQWFPKNYNLYETFKNIMQKYLIFGATGSVGSNLAIQLSQANKEIHLIGRNDVELEKLASELRCDYTVLDILSDDIYENLKKIL